jgi:hypothetical protein
MQARQTGCCAAHCRIELRHRFDLVLRSARVCDAVKTRRCGNSRGAVSA